MKFLALFPIHLSLGLLSVQFNALGFSAYNDLIATKTPDKTFRWIEVCQSTAKSNTMLVHHR